MSVPLGERLKGARTARSLSLEAVGRDAKISQGYLHKLEAGSVTSPSPHVLKRLSEVLDVPYRDLMALAGYLLPDDDATAPRPKSSGKPRTGGPAASNAQLLGHLEALRAEVADLRAQQDEILTALRRLGDSG
jgi:transcriptional regulator with XRE-family HTH domain